MKFMTTWTFTTGKIPEAAELFLSGGGAPEPGVTLMGRWHRVDGTGGVAIFETNDLAALHKGMLKWVGLLELTTVPVLDDREVGPGLVERFKK